MAIYPKGRDPEEGPREKYDIQNIIRAVGAVPGAVRPYGPGKFSRVIDSLIYSLGWYDDEAGSVDEVGWFGLIKNDEPNSFIMSIANQDNVLGSDRDPLTYDEVLKILRARVIIVSEDSNGFVNVEYFNSSQAGENAWRQILEEISQAEWESEDEFDEPDA